MAANTNLLVPSDDGSTRNQRTTGFPMSMPVSLAELGEHFARTHEILFAIRATLQEIDRKMPNPTLDEPDAVPPTSTATPTPTSTPTPTQTQSQNPIQMQLHTQTQISTPTPTSTSILTPTSTCIPIPTSITAFTASPTTLQFASTPAPIGVPATSLLPNGVLGKEESKTPDNIAAFFPAYSTTLSSSSTPGFPSQSSGGVATSPLAGYSSSMSSNLPSELSTTLPMGFPPHLHSGVGTGTLIGGTQRGGEQAGHPDLGSLLQQESDTIKQTASKSGSWPQPPEPYVYPNVQSFLQPDTQSFLQPDSRALTQPANQPGIQSTNQLGNQPTSQPETQPAPQSEAQSRPQQREEPQPAPQGGQGNEGGSKEPGAATPQPARVPDESFMAVIKEVPADIPNSTGIAAYLWKLCELGKSLNRLKETKYVLVEFCTQSHAPPTHADLRGYLQNNSRTYSPGVLKRRLCIIKKFLKLAFLWQPMDFFTVKQSRLETPPPPVPRPAQLLSLEEVTQTQQLIMAPNIFPPFFTAVIDLLYHGGLRLAELLPLRWENVAQDQAGHFTVTYKQNQLNKLIVVPFPDAPAQRLLKMRKNADPHARIFSCSKTKVNELFRKLSAAIGKKVNSKQMRLAQGSLLDTQRATAEAKVEPTGLSDSPGDST